MQIYKQNLVTKNEIHTNHDALNKMACIDKSSLTVKKNKF